MAKKGFTLIELLIVVGILGIVAVGIVTTLNVVGIISKAELSNAKTLAASLENDLAINQVGKWSFEEGTNATTRVSHFDYNN